MFCHPDALSASSQTQTHQGDPEEHAELQMDHFIQYFYQYLHINAVDE